MAADYQPGADSQDRTAAVVAAAAWLAARGVDPAGPVADVLPGIYTDGYLVGAASARATVDGARLDLTGWTPGDTEAAVARLDTLDATAGLSALLSTVPAAARDIADGRLKDLSRVLIDGTHAGDPADVIVDALLEEVGDPNAAAAVATIAVLTAAGLAALDLYGQAGVEMGRWVTDGGNVCPACVSNAAAGPVPIGDAYPSGAVQAPGHPHCRCAVEPA